MNLKNHFKFNMLNGWVTDLPSIWTLFVWKILINVKVMNSNISVAFLMSLSIYQSGSSKNMNGCAVAEKTLACYKGDKKPRTTN